MAILSNTMKEALATAYAAQATHAALYTADPGTSASTSEVSGGAYVRKALSWTAGGSDGITTVSVTFDVPASTAVAYAGIVTSVTAGAGTLLDKVAVTYNSQPSAGQLTVNFTFTQS